MNQLGETIKGQHFSHVWIGETPWQIIGEGGGHDLAKGAGFFSSTVATGAAEGGKERISSSRQLYYVNRLWLKAYTADGGI